MPGPRASPVHKFDAMQIYFASGIGGEKGVLRDSLTRKSDFLLLAEPCPVAARSDGTAGKERTSEGTGRNQAIVSQGA
jgi:hypothetical protein